MFQGVFEKFSSYLDEENKPIFSQDEMECLSNKHSGLFHEGMMVQKSREGAFFGHGLLQITKNMKNNDEILPFVCNLIKLLGKIPSRLSFAKG